ncbi:hypothetical protein ACFWA9_10115 [Kitasatospora sp. NPDC059973]|uniref:hypothetical protein n=1 Tax=Kitasatospora sp. NPDC059973 TaxID=3347020 RepID=UPI00369BFF63
MHPFITRAAALATALTACLFVTAAPAAASSRRNSGEACTHNWNGPQVCIQIDGHDDWADRVTVTWTDPGRGVDRSTAMLHEGGEQREVHIRQEGHRQDGKITAEWTGIRLAWGKVCGSFTGTNGVWACQEVHTGGPYSS